MLGKYGMIGLGVLLLAATARVGFLEFQVNQLETKVDLLNNKNIACNISQDNLKNKLEIQNNKVKEANKVLISTNEELSNIETQNQVLQKDIQKKINEINQVQTASCKDTINWMLEEAIENDETKIIAN
jgi:chromosome segregation ATPase